MPIDPKSAQAWAQLLILTPIAVILALGGFWQWLIKPIQKNIEAAREAVTKETGERKEALEEEREARKAADAHRDERVREARDKMQAALGKTDLLERRMDGSQTDRQQLHREIGEIRTLQQEETKRLRETEIKHERMVGEFKVALAEMEGRINTTISAAIKEVAAMNTRSEK